MRALVYDAYGARPQVRDVGDPVCPRDGAVLVVRATGVCRSDVHAWQGSDPVRLPHVGGHELAGEIVQVGDRVRHWRIGDRVTTPFVCGCGRCAYCTSGAAQVCPDQSQPGFTDWGSFAERVSVRAADFNLVRLPDRLDFTTAASLGCRFATAYRAITGHGPITCGEWMAVYGCGGAGLSAIMIGAAVGLRVIAVDRSPQALARATDCGAEVVVDAGRDDPVAAVTEATGGVPLSLDCAGTPTTAVQSVQSLCRLGRHVQVGLLLGTASTPPIPMDRVIGWELSIHGSHGMAAADYPGLLDLVGSGRLAPDRLITRVTDLAGAGAALLAMADGGPPGITVAVP